MLTHARRSQQLIFFFVPNDEDDRLPLLSYSAFGLRYSLQFSGVRAYGEEVPVRDVS